MKKQEIIATMNDIVKNHIDLNGDVNMSNLAEDAYDLIDPNPEMEVPEIYFEYASEIADNIKKFSTTKILR